MSDFDYAYAAAYGDQDMHFDQWSYWESAEWQFCQCDIIGWCGCLGLFPGGHTIFFCASCHTEKVAENFGFTTIVCYTNIVSKKEKRSLQPPDTL